jgi:hypothetical protein
MYQFKVEPIAIPANSVKLLELKPLTESLLIPTEEGTKGGYDTVTTCIEFGIITPEEFINPKVVFLEAIDINTITRSGSGARKLHDNTKPFILVQKRILLLP